MRVQAMEPEGVATASPESENNVAKKMTPKEYEEAFYREAYQEGRQSVIESVVRGIRIARGEADTAQSHAHTGVLRGAGADARDPAWWGGQTTGLRRAAEIIEKEASRIIGPSGCV